MALRKRTDAFVLHCSATLEHQPFNRKSIKQMHLARGFSDIGYHYLILLDGTVEQGRMPEECVGAHVKGFNETTLGIVYIGGLRSSDAKPTDTRNPAQLKGMEALLRKLCKKYPSAVILGHRDLSPDLDKDGEVTQREWMKICPCFAAGPWAKSLGLPGARYSNGKYVRL